MSHKSAFFALLLSLAVLIPATSFARDDHGQRGGWGNDRGNVPQYQGSYDRVRNQYNERLNRQFAVPQPERQVIVRRTYVPVPVAPQPTYFNDVTYYPTYPTTTYTVVQPDYYVGERIVTYYPVPQPYAVRMRPAPYGYYYSHGGNNRVLLVSQRDNTIVQILALSLLLR